MPRTGFVWPVMEPEVTAPGLDQQTEKQKDTDETNPTSGSSSRKQQNHFLLFNAMRTTAAHSSTTFMNNTRPVVDQPPATETAPPETIPVERARSLSVAATPAPPLRRSSTPRVTGTSQAPEISKPQSGVPPKRKKKRECMHGSFGSSACLTCTCITGTNTAGNTPAPN
jgi:mediator of RNA polymerase II transcription subunit 6